MAINLDIQSDLDWQKAQSRYQNALNQKVSEPDAAALYLAPIQAKWKIIKSAPDKFQDPLNLGKINSDFEQAQTSASQALLGGQFPASLPTTESKWATMPNPVERFDPKIEAAALKSVSSGSKSAADVISENPGVLLDPESRAMWTGLVRAEIAGGKKGKMGARQQEDLKRARKSYNDKIDQFGVDAPETKAAAAALDALSNSSLPTSDSGDAGTITATAPSAASALSLPTQSLPPVGGDELSPYFASVGFHAPTGPVSIPAPDSAPSPAEALTNPKPVIYITGGKGNTVDRAGADAAWQAKYGSLKEPKSSVTAPVTIPDAKDLVSVINPQGKRVRIKKDQLDDALTQGYKTE